MFYSINESKSYVNKSVFKPAEQSVKKNLVHSANFVKKQILSRGAHLGLAPFSVISSAIETIIGLGAGIGTILKGGEHTATFNFALKHLQSSEELLARPYKNLLRTINPKAEFSKDTAYKTCVAVFLKEFNGLLAGSLYTKAFDLSQSPHILHRHVTSRLTYALSLISSIIVQVACAAIGVLAGVFSILTVGKFKSLNSVAYVTLQETCKLSHLFNLTIKIINPWASPYNN